MSCTTDLFGSRMYIRIAEDNVYCVGQEMFVHRRAWSRTVLMCVRLCTCLYVSGYP